MIAGQATCSDGMAPNLTGEATMSEKNRRLGSLSLADGLSSVVANERLLKSSDMAHEER